MDRLRILFVVPFPPRLAGTHGGAKAIGELIFRSAERHDVALLYLRHEQEARPEPELVERVERVQEIERASAPTGVARLVRAVRRRVHLVRGTPLWVSELADARVDEAVAALLAGRQPDIVRLEYPVSASFLPTSGPNGAKTVLVDYDPLLADVRTESSMRERFERTLDRRAWRRFNRRARRRADAFVVLTERDRRVVEENGSARLLVRIPLGIEPMPALDSAGRDDVILFVGNMNHPANREAVAHLVADIFPRVRARRPQASLVVVGEAGPDDVVPPTAGVRLTGLVDDVVPYLDDAAVVLAPLRAGGGMRVKVLEALSAGKAVVAYQNAVEGIEVERAREAIVAKDADEFADAVVDLLGDRAARERLGRAARAWALDHAGWDAVLDAYDDLYGRLV